MPTRVWLSLQNTSPVAPFTWLSTSIFRLITVFFHENQLVALPSRRLTSPCNVSTWILGVGTRKLTSYSPSRRLTSPCNVSTWILKVGTRKLTSYSPSRRLTSPCNVNVWMLGVGTQWFCYDCHLMHRCIRQLSLEIYCGCRAISVSSPQQWPLQP